MIGISGRDWLDDSSSRQSVCGRVVFPWQKKSWNRSQVWWLLTTNYKQRMQWFRIPLHLFPIETQNKILEVEAPEQEEISNEKYVDASSFRQSAPVHWRLTPGELSLRWASSQDIFFKYHMNIIQESLWPRKRGRQNLRANFECFCTSIIFLTNILIYFLLFCCLLKYDFLKNYDISIIMCLGFSCAHPVSG